MGNTNKIKIVLGVVLIALAGSYIFWGGVPTGLFIGGSTTTNSTMITTTTTTTLSAIRTFIDNGGAIETKKGKPVIRLFSTTGCPHCRWIKDAYEETVREYVDRGEIIAYHWEFDLDDNTLTAEKELVPKSEKEIFRRFNSRGTVPTFVFGSKYYRIGNGYEREGDLEAEKAEFRAVIEELIRESKQV